MCGIFGFVSKKKQPANLILDSLKQLEYRGYDSWGIVTASDSTFLIDKHIGKIGNASTKLAASVLGLGHTRWATHGGVTKANAHPHLDCTKQITAVHNGIIENYLELKKNLTKNHKFISETDTEVSVHMIEELCPKIGFEKAFIKTFKKFDGLNALIAIHCKQEELLVAKTGSPLIIGFGTGINYVASDPASLLKHTKSVYFLEDGQMAKITAEKVSIYDLKAEKEIVYKKQHISWSYEDTCKGTFDHFMLKEIYDQPKVIDQILASNGSQIKKLASLVKKSWGATMVACGSAAYAALCGTYLFSKIAKRHLNYSYGSEFGYILDFINPKSLIIPLSQSGETIDIIDSVKKAKLKGATIASMVNVLGSSLYRLSDFKILLNAGPEKAVASTKAFVAKLANLILLSYELAGNYDKGRELLEMASSETRRLLTKENILKLKNLAKVISSKKDIYSIGRGVSYPIALESCLKIKEVSYIHAEGFAAGELKHGFIALVEKGVPCLVFAPNDETYNETLSGAMEVKARGGKIIGVSSKNHEIFDEYIEVNDCAEATIIPNTVVAQVLAYFLAIEKGLDPDKPRNLAKSVTVK